MNPLHNHTIISKKQDNGLWGIPLQCTSFDSAFMRCSNNEKLRSAIIISIAETNFNENFSILYSDDDGFYAKFHSGGRVRYNLYDYELDGSTLKWRWQDE